MEGGEDRGFVSGVVVRCNDDYTYHYLIVRANISSSPLGLRKTPPRLDLGINLSGLPTPSEGSESVLHSLFVPYVSALVSLSYTSKDIVFVEQMVAV